MRVTHAGSTFDCLKVFSRYNVLSLWWNDIHKPTVYCVLCLVATGLLAIFSASYNIGDVLNVSDLYFFKKQVVFLCVAFVIFFILTFQTTTGILQFSLIGFAVSIFMMMAVLTMSGKSVKGAERWLDLRVMTIQPSEILKPFFIVITAYLYFMFERTRSFFFPLIQIGIYIVIVTLLFFQPDFGMILTYSFITFVQIFFSGIKMKTIFYFMMPFVIVALIGAVSLSHVRTRIVHFVTGEKVYQTDLAYSAIKNGGMLGLGLGSGKVSKKIPDSHNDFIFARIGEELGSLYLIVIIVIFCILILSNVIYAKNEYLMYEKLQESPSALEKYQKETVINYYIIILVSSLIFFEMFINMAVNLSLIPPKGMVLPFISYGGSSIIAHAFLIGFLCIANRRKYRFVTTI